MNRIGVKILYFVQENIIPTSVWIYQMRVFTWAIPGRPVLAGIAQPGLYQTSDLACEEVSRCKCHTQLHPKNDLHFSWSSSVKHHLCSAEVKREHSKRVHYSLSFGPKYQKLETKQQAFSKSGQIAWWSSSEVSESSVLQELGLFLEHSNGMLGSAENKYSAPVLTF